MAIPLPTPWTVVASRQRRAFRVSLHGCEVTVKNRFRSLVVVQDLFRVNGTHAATSKHLRSAGDGISCLLYPVRSLA